MAKIKAGTYRFNDVLSVPSGGADSGVFNFTTEALGYIVHCNNLYAGVNPELTYVVDSAPSELEEYLGSLGIALPFHFLVFDGERWLFTEYGEAIQTISISEDSGVSDEFYEWFTANAKRLSTITYNGSTIATLGGGQSATLKCAGMKMESDVVVEVAQMPEGGGDVEFNIAYGDTEPADTSKLWVKADKPNSLKISTRISTTETLIPNIASLPIAVCDMGTASVENKIYMFGGVGTSILDTIIVFDTSSKTSTTLSAKLPRATNLVSAVAVGTKIYLFGGSYEDSSYKTYYLDTINVFDTETDTISTLSVKLPTALDGIRSVAIDKQIYLFGGRSSGTGQAKIYKFDTTTNTISTLSAALQTGASEMGAVAVGTKIYLFGGRSKSTTYLDTITVFDTVTKTVSTLSVKLPATNYGMGVGAIGTKIYLFGGSNSDYQKTINVFDTETDTISTFSTSFGGKRSMGAVTIDTDIYLCGGLYGNALDTVDCFSVLSTLPNGVVQLTPSLTKNIFTLINIDEVQMEIGVDSVHIGNSEGYAEKVTAALYKDGAWTDI